MTPVSWNDQALPLYEKTKWSPPVAADFEGVDLWIPERISLAETHGRIPIAGVVRLGTARWKEILPQELNPLLAVVVGAILGGQNTPYVGQAVLQAPLFPPPDTSPMTEYFNVDLRECAALPRFLGRLHLFASLGPHLAAGRSVEITA